MRVRIFGVVVASDIPIPGEPAPASARTFLRIRAAGRPGTRAVRWRTVARDPMGRPWMRFARDGELRILHVRSVGRFSLSADGRTIEAFAEPGADPATFQRVIVDHVLPRALHRAGLTVLHASAVAGPRGAVVYVGESGSGKSTAAARAALRGWPLLADDGVRLEIRGGAVLAHPSHPCLRVREDIFRGLPVRVRESAIPGAGKWVLDARHPPLRFAGGAVPVRRIHLLGETRRVRERLKGREGVLALMAGVFRADPWDAGSFQGDLRFFAGVVIRVPVSRHDVRG